MMTRTNSFLKALIKNDIINFRSQLPRGTYCLSCKKGKVTIIFTSRLRSQANSSPEVFFTSWMPCNRCKESDYLEQVGNVHYNLVKSYNLTHSINYHKEQ